MATTALAGPAFAQPTLAGNLDGAATSLLASNRPKTVILDVKTGEIQSVTPGIPAQASVTVGSICTNSTHACYYSERTPYADKNFYGSTGTATGSWPYRSGGWSGGYYAKFCWNSGTCGPQLNPNTVFSFGSGVTATGISVRLA